MAMQHPYFDDLDKSKILKEYWELHASSIIENGGIWDDNRAV